FNLMFKTFLGPVEEESNVAYLRPETAQAMFTNFKLVQEAMRLKIPFGIAQIGHCFRNEITTGNFTFRSREFDIAEIEYFVKPGEDEKIFEQWLGDWENFFLNLGLKKENLRRYEHKKESLAHYSKRTVDLEYRFPWGWAELAGVANRTDFDLSQHAKFSGKDLGYFDEEAKKSYVPYVIEPTLGVERLALALIVDAYEEIKGGRTETTKAVKEEEVVLRLDKKIAPVTVAVLPLVKNKPNLTDKAKEVYKLLKADFNCRYDEVGSIGRRYRRQDEIGTPWCVTVDFGTLEDDDVTLRDRDSMAQERVAVKNLPLTLKAKLG
ncbi:MAG: glycine--tRNA ligase, partial [Candidatus Nealsonbacteria bacterium]|nr:glycine--tRNA ligase [Candidatus Nealsonbacteria bacterium]